MQRRMVLSLALITATPVIALQTEIPATLTYPTSCSSIQAAALPFFSARGISLLAQPNCPGCLIGKTSDLHDAANKKISTTHAMHTYMQPTVRKSNPLVWYTHSSMDAVAHLTLLDVGSTCQASLIFHYSWYGAQMIVVMPVDGDSESRPSNLRLEKEYLDEIAKHLPPH
jgi:hypothetical protein